MKDHLDCYRNPSGWVEFWVGLVVFAGATGLFGRIIYLDNMVKRSDEAIRQKAEPKSQLDK
jgi:hypothetical protein